jgi:hypothetical protein
MTEHDNTVAAAQEHAAKHVGAEPPCVQKKMARCFNGRASFYAFINHISPLYVYRYSWVRKISSSYNRWG